jgi:hypothetical protein
MSLDQVERGLLRQLFGVIGPGAPLEDDRLIRADHVEVEDPPARLPLDLAFDPSGEANIRMTLTAPNCPLADMLVEDVNTQVAKVNGVEKVNVILVFEPAWDRSMMSEEALLELNLL